MMLGLKHRRTGATMVVAILALRHPMAHSQQENLSTRCAALILAHAHTASSDAAATGRSLASSRATSFFKPQSIGCAQARRGSSILMCFEADMSKIVGWPTVERAI